MIFSYFFSFKTHDKFVDFNVAVKEMKINFFKEAAIVKPKKIITKEIIPKKIINDFSETEITKNEYQEIKPKSIPIIENIEFAGNNPRPLYPRRSLRIGEEGIVMVQALINEIGEVENIKIIQSSGYILLDKSAKNTILNWRFKPHLINGQPNMAWVKIPVEFKIS